MSRLTGLLDKHGVEIREGDRVSLDGNMTADNSMGALPNGWFFDETDVYEVYFDERARSQTAAATKGAWVLKLNCQPDSPENIKYMNHANSLLHDGRVEIVKP